MKNEFRSENEENNYYKRRTSDRRKNLLINIKKLLKKNSYKPISTIEIYNVVFKKGYAFSVETLYRDLNMLEEEKNIEKKVVHYGKGYGTRSMWIVPNLEQVNKK